MKKILTLFILVILINTVLSQNNVKDTINQKKFISSFLYTLSDSFYLSYSLFEKYFLKGYFIKGYFLEGYFLEGYFLEGYFLRRSIFEIFFKYFNLIIHGMAWHGMKCTSCNARTCNALRVMHLDGDTKCVNALHVRVS
jgi:hypothetical protein